MSKQDTPNTNTEQQEVSRDTSILDLTKNLGISNDLSNKINKLPPDEKEDLLHLLKKIIEQEGKDSKNSDKNQKINNTLKDFGITDSEAETIDKVSNRILTLKETVDINKERYEKLQKNLESVKNLDPTIVGEELSIAKASNPLPNEVKLTIAKSSNSTPEQVDEAIKSGNNPQISNLVDTYYLSQASTIDAISKKLPEGKITTEFQELRASAREFGLPYTERANNVKSLITNQSDATQGKVIETVNSLTKGAPDTVITRDGDRLSWEDKKGSKYEIDMAVRPPKLAKSLNGLSISKEIESVSPEQKEKQILEDKKSKVTEVVIKDAGKVQLNAPENIPDSIQEKNVLESYRQAQEGYQKAKNPTEKLETLKTLKEQNHLLEGERRKSMTTENMSDDKYAKLEEGLFKEMDGLNQLEVSLSDFIETDKKLLTYQGVESKRTIESFDNNADVNLSYLVANNYDRLGPSANEAMNRIITEINRTRTSNNQIDLTERLNQATDGKVLIQALEKLGGTPDIFTNGDKLPQFQDTITAAVTKNADNPGSIESLMRSN